MPVWEALLGQIADAFVWFHFWKHPDHLLKLLAVIVIALSLWKLWIDVV